MEGRQGMMQFIVGIFIGGVIGVVMMAIMVAGRDDDD